MEREPPIPQANCSIFQLILWIFAIGSEVSLPQHKKISNLYGSPYQNLNPLVSSEKEFIELMEKIKGANKRFIIKVVTDKEMEKCVIKAYLQQQYAITKIYLYYHQLKNSYFQPRSLPVPRNTHEQIQNQNQNYQSSMNYNQKIYEQIFFQLDECITCAQRQIQSISKTYRTFQNSHLLVQNFEKINRYRFRLVSFINLKVSDFEKSLQLFYQYAKKELPNLNSHLRGIGRNQITMGELNRKLLPYNDLAKQFMEKEFRREKKRAEKALQNKNPQQQIIENIQKQKQQFYHRIISIYQDEGIFFYLLNSNLKLIGDLDKNWITLTLPFNHVYNAIKYFYLNQILKQNQFYLKPFTVYRIGKARKSELEKYELYQGTAFVEFYGFLSTSLSVKAVVDKFMEKSIIESSSGQSTEEQADEQVIFRILVNPNKEILDKKYNYLVNGFFELGQRQRNGKKEKQVLFNALNVFKLKKKSKFLINQLFSTDEKQKMAASITLPHQTQQKKQLIYTMKDQRQRLYQKQITVIDLEFGSFYDLLLSKARIQEQDKAARENYIYCMNKIRQFQQFDEGDVYQLTNDLQECYKYLITKVSRGQDNQQQEDTTDQLMISVIDNKNYFQRLSTVCNKLGKAKEALAFSSIAIQCQEKLKTISQSNLYNQYSQKLLNMRYKSLEIYQQSGDYIEQGKKLKEQLIFARQNAESLKPLAQIDVAKIYISQAINYYRRGKLQESKNRFIKCSRKLSKIISQYSFDVEEQCCYIGAYIKNFLCCQCLCYCFCKFKQNLRNEQKEKRAQQLITKYGSKQFLQNTCKLANDLLILVNNATDQRNGVFKSRKKYQDFLLLYGQRYNIFPPRKENQTQKTSIINFIRDTILKLAGLPQNSQLYAIQSQKLQKKIEQLDVYSLNHLGIEQNQSFIREFIKTFRQKQIQKRLKEIREKMEKNIQNNLIDDYTKCATEIQESIQQLRREGYIEGTLKILKKRSQKALIYYECDSRKLALAEINQIIKNGTIRQENHSCQLANAYLTKGKIQLQSKDIKNAYNSLSQSINYFKQDLTVEERMNQIQVEEMISVSEISVKRNNNKNNRIANIYQQDQITEKYESLQAKILRIRALLIWIEKKKKEQNRMAEDLQRRVYDFWQNHSNYYMREVQKQIEHLRKIIKEGSEIQLQCSLQEIQFQYNMNLPQNQLSLKDIFKPLERCIQIYKLNNLKNIYLIYADNILRYHKRPNSLRYFIEYKCKEQLIKAEGQGIGQLNYWKILKAKYWVQKQMNNNRMQIKECLINAIKILQQKVSKTRFEYLYQEISELKKELPQINVQSSQSFVVISIFQ